MSRRNRTVNVCRYTRSLPAGSVHFIVDSSDLKICGQREWHSRRHGEKLRKHWRKLHLGVDENGHERDSSQVPYLLAQVDRKIDRFVGDGIYDQKAVYEDV